MSTGCIGGARMGASCVGGAAAEQVIELHVHTCCS